MSEPARNDLALREATAQDCEFVWLTHNEEECRRLSIRSEAIPWEDHQRWYASSLQSATRTLLIVEEDETPVGVVRFDQDSTREDHAIISIALRPEARGRRLGREVLARAVERAHGEYEAIIAYILLQNERSLRAFKAAGFKLRGEAMQGGKRLIEMIATRG